MEGFSRELLGQPPQVRRAFFDAYTAGHAQLMETYEDLKRAILDAMPGGIILLYGPTGVGKTTLLNKLNKHLTEEALPELEKDRGRFPVVYIRTVTPDKDRFDWKDFFRRLLIQLDEPAVDHKIDVQKWEQSQVNRRLIDDHKTSGSHFRYAAEQALKNRRPLALLVDEAQHIGITGSGQKLLNQLNVLKSIADETKITHVLCGTYELLPFRNLNGQLSRRSRDIHFPRYRADQPEQMKGFQDVLWTFQHKLPLEHMPDLMKDWDFFYERTIGCIGILKDWLSSALALSLRESGVSLTRAHLEATAPSVAQCMRQLTEAVEGERQLTESEESRDLLRQYLQLETGKKGKMAELLPAEPVATAKRSRRGRVGTRNPVRDPIGEKAA
jgi:energy-coupling factor transporter ATP-binding protein EcfA2